MAVDLRQLRSLGACERGCEGRCAFCPDEVGREAADEIERLREALSGLFAELMNPDVVIARMARSDEPLDRAVRLLKKD